MTAQETAASVASDEACGIASVASGTSSFRGGNDLLAHPNADALAGLLGGGHDNEANTQPFPSMQACHGATGNWPTWCVVDDYEVRFYADEHAARQSMTTDSRLRRNGNKCWEPSL